MPLVVEISVAFSVLIAFIVIGVFLFRIRERFGSTISLKAVWLLLVDTLALFIRYSIRHEYDAALAARAGGGGTAAPGPG